MKEQIFRKTSLDRVNSPEQLNEYIRVANPSVWLILGAVILLLLGACVWGIFGTIETTEEIPVSVEDQTAMGYFSAQSTRELEAGMEVQIGGQTGTVVSVAEEPVRLEEGTSSQILSIGGFAEGDFCYPVEISVQGLSDGVYEATVVVERISPIYFVIH